jgi:D-tyrosyl-tRNA(Tyr) deacylase
MRAVIQRVTRADVSVNHEVVGSIQQGLLVFLGIQFDDRSEDADWLIKKIIDLRVFEDFAGKMNRSVMDIEGDVLVISQFTLYGNLKKGTRPSFNRAAPPDVAAPLYEMFIEKLSNEMGKAVPSGVFGALMYIDAMHEGPVTLMLDTRQKDF